jgi:hypothetical protein
MSYYHQWFRKFRGQLSGNWSYESKRYPKVNKRGHVISMNTLHCQCKTATDSTRLVPFFFVDENFEKLLMFVDSFCLFHKVDSHSRFFLRVYK